MQSPSTQEPLVARWARRLMLDRHAEFWLGELDPARSVSETRARVVRVVDETPDTKTFVLRPNARWRGHRAGQLTTVGVEIDGVRVSRCYSLSSASTDPLPTITVKRVPGGRVSGWLHDRIEPGDVLTLGEAAGDFVLPDPAPRKLLLYSGGSGITPVMSILRDLSHRDAVDDVVFVHHARSRRDVIFGAELEALAAQHPSLWLELRLDDELGTAARYDETWLRREIPDFAERWTMLCGPAGLMKRVEETWARAGASSRLMQERFTASLRLANPTGVAPRRVTVELTGAGRTVEADGSRSLLEQLEEAGERPAHGCRMGICNTCACRKRAGTVRNLITGAESSEPDEEIRLCVSAPLSDLELSL